MAVLATRLTFFGLAIDRLCIPASRLEDYGMLSMLHRGDNDDQVAAAPACSLGLPSVVNLPCGPEKDSLQPVKKMLENQWIFLSRAISLPLYLSRSGLTLE